MSDKKYYDEIRRKIKEAEEKRRSGEKLPLEKRRGITVLPVKPKGDSK